TWGCGGTSDITSARPSNDGQGRADVDGSPLAAKLAQAARMAAASRSWSALSGPWKGAPGSSKRYGSIASDLDCPAGSPIALLVNGLSSTPLVEQYLVYRAVRATVVERGLRVERLTCARVRLWLTRGCASDGLQARGPRHVRTPRRSRGQQCEGPAAR